MYGSSRIIVVIFSAGLKSFPSKRCPRARGRGGAQEGGNRPKGLVQTIYAGPNHKPFPPKPSHLMYTCYDLLCRILQRIKLKLNLNYHPSCQEKERQMMATSIPTSQGQVWRAHTLAIQRGAGGTLEEGRGSMDHCSQGWLSLRARQCYESCLHLESFDSPKNPSGRFYCYSASTLQETEAGDSLLPGV